MKLIKKINNNYSLALDSKGETIIVEGRGIGFHKMPYELTDLSVITRTYYDIKEHDINLVQSVPTEILSVSSEVYEYAKKIIGEKLNPNLTFTLADHIQFAIERYEQNIDIKMPIYYDIEHLYPDESMIADYAMKLIKKNLKITLPKSEKTGIALNIVNSVIITTPILETKDDIIEQTTIIIQDELNITISRDSYSYSRFVSHLEYLLRRPKNSEKITDDNLKKFTSVFNEMPKIKDVISEISNYLKNQGFPLNTEEELYLMIHINRLYNYENNK